MDDYEFHLYEEARAGRITRAELIKRAGVAGISLSAFGALLRSESAVAENTSIVGGQVKRGGIGRVGAVAPPADLEPVTMYGGATYPVQAATEYLCWADQNLRVAPKLATSWKASNPSTWTFAIRQGVKWHDGSSLTADDVVATFNRVTDPASNSFALSAFKGILSKGNIEKVDAQHVRFHLDRPYADFPYLVTEFNYDTVILPQNYQIGDFVKGGVGTGPFIFKSYVPKTSATLVRNPNYWAPGLPYLDGLEIKYYSDTAPIALALQAGDIDVFAQTPFQGSQALYHDPSIVVLQGKSSEYRTVHMRTDRPPFNDKRIRQAVALCLDRPAIVRGLFNGKADLGNDHAFAPVYPDSALALKMVPQRKQNYALAKKLLAAAGHAKGLKVTLTTEQLLEIPQYAVFIKQMCKSAGIDINLDIMSQSDYYGSGKDQPWLAVPFGIVDWGARGSASQTATAAFLCTSLWNEARWCDHRYDSLLRQLDAELDHQKRLRLAAAAAKIQNDEVPDIIAYWIREQRAVRKNVHGIAAVPTFHLDPSRMWLS